MRIHRIRLRNYRGVDNHEVAFPPTGVTVVQGDNEVGKSSIAEALELLFEYQDSSTTKAVKAVKPVHDDVGSEVEADIEAGPYRFTYFKRFHKDRKTILKVSAPAPESLTGREAHERVNAILDEAVDMALWKALRLQQGVRPDQADLSEQTSLAAALDAASAGALGGGREATLVDLAKAEFDKYWTATGRVGKQVAELAAADEQAEARVADLRRRLADLEHDVDHHATVAARLEAYQRDIDEQARLVADDERRWNEVQAVVQQETATQLAADRAELDAAAAADALARRQTLADDVAAAEQRHRDLAAEQRRHQPDLDAAVAAVREAEAKAAAAAEQARQVQAFARRRQADVNFANDCLFLEQMEQRVDRVRAAQPELAAVEALLDANRVDAAAADAVEEAHVAVVHARARAEGDSPVLDIEALRAVDVDVDGQGGRLDAGARTSAVVAGETTVEIAGVVRMVVRGGREAGRLADALKDAEERLAEACRAAGVANVAEARAAHAARQDALRRREHLAAQLKADLHDLTADELFAKTELVRARVAEARATRQDDPAAANVDVGTALRLAAQADAAVGTAADLVREAEAQVALARDALDAARGHAAVHERDDELARLQLDAARHALDDARAKVPDGVLEGRVEELSAKAALAAGALARAREAAERARPDDVRATLDNARGVLEKLQRERQDALGEIERIRGRLGVLGEEGLHDRLAEAEAEREHARRLRRSTEHKAAAAKRLYETLMRCRAEARHAYLAPLKEKIDKLGGLVFGPDFSVELGDDLRIARRTVGGVTVDFDQLSMGAREQLCVISRLACAALVAGGGGVPVVLDDALGWSDPARLKALGAVLALAAREAQVIVLTCVPERYRHVGSAHVVQLR